MDIEKLIERLEAWNEQHLSVVCGSGHFACDYLCESEDCIVVQAATALSTLQAENAEMQKQLNEFSEFLCHMTGGLLSKTNYTAHLMISEAENYQQKVCGECDLQAENEKLRAELEQIPSCIYYKQGGLCRYGGDDPANVCVLGPCDHDVSVQDVLTELEQVKAERDAIEQDFRDFTKQWWEEDSGFPCRWCKFENASSCEWKVKCQSEEKICAGRAFEWRGQKEE